MKKRILVVTKSFINKHINHTQQSNTLFQQQVNNFHYEKGLQIENILKKYFTNIQVMQLHEFHNECIKSQVNFQFPNEADYIITLGGDGTFLSCTHCINKHNQIILGVNSNPEKSVGHLCTFPFDLEKLDQAFQRIYEEDYNIYKRKRGLIKIYNEERKKIDEFIFMNDVFFGTSDPGTTLRYNFHCKEKNLLMENIKSTGCIFYTGTGSSAWVKTMNNTSYDMISRVLRMYDQSVTQEQVNEVYNNYIKSTNFDPQESKLGYLHRELYYNKNGLEEREGYSNEFFIKIDNTNAFMAFDGLHYDLKRGVDISISIDDKYDLNCFDFSQLYFYKLFESDHQNKKYLQVKNLLIIFFLSTRCKEIIHTFQKFNIKLLLFIL